MRHRSNAEPASLPLYLLQPTGVFITSGINHFQPNTCLGLLPLQHNSWWKNPDSHQNYLLNAKTRQLRTSCHIHISTGITSYYQATPEVPSCHFRTQRPASSPWDSNRSTTCTTLSFFSLQQPISRSFQPWKDLITHSSNTAAATGSWPWWTTSRPATTGWWQFFRNGGTPIPSILLWGWHSECLPMVGLHNSLSYLPRLNWSANRCPVPSPAAWNRFGVVSNPPWRQQRHHRTPSRISGRFWPARGHPVVLGTYAI